MRPRYVQHPWKAALNVIAVMLLLLGCAQAVNQFQLLHTFQHKPAKYPDGALVADSAGNLYGTTENGLNQCDSPQHCGVVFKLAQDSGGKWVYTILHVFKGPDGGSPESRLIFDSSGNLYGTTRQGGANDAGTVFELSPAGDKWNEKVLHSFGVSGDVNSPFAGVTFDVNGNLYGTATGGGLNGNGGVFELTPTGSGWHERVIHHFNRSGGSGPTCDLLWDSAGNLYGTTQSGGKFNWGVVFELTSSSNGTWTEAVLYQFTGVSDGAFPAGGLTSDAAGNLYGTTQECTGDCGGTVFMLTKSSGKWIFGVVHAFGGAEDGGGPYTGVIFDASGNLYGTTTHGGKNGQGTVFRLSPSGGQWQETVIHSFDQFGGKGGSEPFGGLILGPMGNLYGTTSLGGAAGYGVVFSLAP